MGRPAQERVSVACAAAHVCAAAERQESVRQERLASQAALGSRAGPCEDIRQPVSGLAVVTENLDDEQRKGSRPMTEDRLS